jgi:hypothetical protein
VSVVHLYSLIQRDADKYNGKWDVAEIEKIPMRDVTGKNVIGHFTVRVRFQEDTQGASFPPPPMFPLTPPALFVSSDPRKAPPGPSEAVRLPSLPPSFLTLRWSDVSRESAGSCAEVWKFHSCSIQTIWVRRSSPVLPHLPRRYRSLMDWENPAFTFTIFGRLSFPHPHPSCACLTVTL